MKNTNLISSYDLESMQIKFLVPRLNVKIKISRHDSLKIFGIDDADYAEIINTDTGETIITVKADILKTSSWTEWESYLLENDVSVHSPVYRIMKAIFDGKVFVEKDADDEYGVEYDDYIAGYFI